MEKQTFLKYLDSTKALGHLLIASLALLSYDSFQIVLFFSDGTQITYPIKITELLKQMKYFSIYSHDHSKRYYYDLEPAINLIKEGNPDREKSIILLYNTVLHIPIVRAFELIKNYCKETNQLSLFKKQEWYNVARVIRNCFSHNFNIEIRASELNQLPYTWKNIRITREMIGKPIKFSDISEKSFGDLLKTMIEFAHSLN